MSDAVLTVQWEAGGITVAMAGKGGEERGRATPAKPATVAGVCGQVVQASGAALSQVQVSAVPGLVAVDAAGSLVAVLVGDDPDTTPDAGWLTGRLPGEAEDWQAAVGAAPDASWTLAKLSWLHRSDAAAWSAMAAALTPQAWLVAALTGDAVTDAADASRTGAWADGTYRWDLLAIVDGALDWAGMVPAVAAPDAPLGTWRGAPILAGGRG